MRKMAPADDERRLVYVETTVVSYLTAHPSRDLVVAAHQEITRSWWAHRAADFAAGAHFLLSWNCKHIANASRRAEIERVCREQGLVPPVVCTPLELMEA
jgi:hypothetical protein